jgi:malonyl-CoA decarboxylase
VTKESLVKTDVAQVEDKKAVKGFFKILGEVADAVTYVQKNRTF